ncbi:MAG: F0F1 ATP synthase subunit epsilon [Dysgonamonadaceae bacterium]|jgi:F-type H+-transporting ATPase subunit epsilon|nr:F0F1 ATP synthase subunit epsilon [Dysgonamonadaceae bacterium]
MTLNIISPEKKLFPGEINSVTLPGAMGSFTILKDHAPIISSLQKGIITYCCDEDGSEMELEIEGGFVEGKQNEVNVCID